MKNIGRRALIVSLGAMLLSTWARRAVAECPANCQEVEWRKFTAPEPADNDQSGFRVGVAADLGVVGAYWDDYDGNTDSGSAFILRRDEGGANNWGLWRHIKSPEPELDGQFGHEVAISCGLSGGAAFDTVFSTAPHEDEGAPNAGAAYVFERNQGGVDNWGLVRKFTLADLDPGYTPLGGEILGECVALDGDTAVIGAPGGWVGGSFQQGAAYVVQRNQGGTNNWGLVKKLTASDGGSNDKFGFLGCAIDRDTIVVGAPFDGPGAAYVYKRNQGGTNNWGEVKKLVSGNFSGGVELFQSK